MKTKAKKQISSKPFLEMIKDLKNSRSEMQDRVYDFNRELERDTLEAQALCRQLHALQTNMEKNRHLIEMYRVDDEHTIFDIWKLETACGLTKLDFMRWKHEFEKTPYGKPFEIKHKP